METKARILYLKQILEQRTDEEHPLTTNQLIAILKEEYNISVHRTTIVKDIEALQEFGVDIITLNSTQSKYFVASRLFEVPELKLLIDAVESSKVITQKKSEGLIAKINSLASFGQVDKLKRNNYITKRIKPCNEGIYYIVDVINDAINRNKQITFKYYEYSKLKEKVLKNSGKAYTLSPYHLVWNDDYYYVLGYSKKHEKIATFRVDRIAGPPEALETEAIEKPRDFNLAEFTKSVFFMYDGKVESVELCCDNSLMKIIVDRFGEDVVTSVYDDTNFKVSVEVAVSPTFWGFIFSLEEKVKILAPECLKRRYKDMIIARHNDIVNV